MEKLWIVGLNGLQFSFYYNTKKILLFLKESEMIMTMKNQLFTQDKIIIYLILRV